MAHNLKINVATYNLHGLNQGSSFLEYLSVYNDVVFVQEHWLAPFNINQLESACPSYVCYATSAMNDVISSGVLRGRPFGGVAVLVKQKLASNFNIVKLSSRYIILKAWSTLFINVYLPCTSTTDWENEYLDCLACIINDISDVQYKTIIMGGDFNVDFASKHPMVAVLHNLMADFALYNLDSKLPSGTKSSYRVHTTGASSLIDHFFVSDSLCDSVITLDVADNGSNLSDHCAVVMQLYLPVEEPQISAGHINTGHGKNVSSRQFSYRWDKADLSKYYAVSLDYLNTIPVPMHLLNGDGLACFTRDDIQFTIDCFYRSIVSALHYASCVCVPKVKRDFYKFWWDEELTALKQASLDSFKLWSAIGKPRCGSEFYEMQRAKAAYKLALRNKERNSQHEFTNSLNDALLNKDLDSFWRSWRAKFGSNNRSSVIDGCSDDIGIADKFGTLFKSCCVPNSQSQHDLLKAKFQTRFDSYMDDKTLPQCNVELVDDCIRHLKRGKAAGFDELTVEHLLYAHPILVVLLSLLFTLLVLHGTVPLDFGKGIIIPLIKNLDNDKTSCDNYRGITISPVVSKVFETVLMRDLHSYLQSDNLQFGFKKNSSCSHAIFALRSVVNHYCNSGSTITICALDISKAFDRVDHYALLTLLMDRKIPKYFISVMLRWFHCCISAVRWGSALSSFFTIYAGVRQGGLLSPLLFTIYIDVLIIRLRQSGLGCKLLQQYFGCIVYADDIILLSHSINAMSSMLKICEEFALDFDVKFNSVKSSVMRIGERYDADCAPLTLGDCELQFVQCLKYLGVHILTGKHFSCCVKNARMKFYRTFNAIYCRSKGANSEVVSVQLFKSYCLPFILYATEAISLAKSSVRILDECIQRAVVKIFKVYDKDNIAVIRHNCDLPYVGTLIERRRLKFVNKLLDTHFMPFLFCF